MRGLHLRVGCVHGRLMYSSLVEAGEILRGLIQPGSPLRPIQTPITPALCAGDESTANAKLLDVLRQVQCFGLALMRLDIRQESTRHTDVSPGVG